MQTTSTRFAQLASGNVRPLSWAFRASFDKQFDPATTFFTLDESILDGPDLLAPSDANVVQEWDKYLYADYSSRIKQVEWSREQNFPYSVNLAICDLVLNNYDGYFTRGNNSPIDQYLLPSRPVRVLAGFNGENIPQFVGLTEKSPEVERTTGLARLHAQDFLSYLFSKPLDKAISYENIRTDEALSELFQMFGLTPSQYVLDVGFNTINFLYFEKDTTLGDACRELMEAEMGSLYMDENGVIRFKNRLNHNNSPVYYFNNSNIVDYKVSDEDTIINVVEIKSEVRAVQPTQAVLTIASPIPIMGTVDTEVFFDFEDPVVELEPITGYTANAAEDGSGADLTGNISVVDTDLFSTSAKVTFANSSATPAYITNLIIYGKPATVIKKIALRVQDDDSVAAFDERPILIENNYIQDNSAANSVALSILNYYKNYSNTIEFEVKGTYALQLGDNIHVGIDNIDQVYTITKITNTLDGKFRQIIKGTVFNIPTFFVLDQSILDGPDVLAP